MEAVIFGVRLLYMNDAFVASHSYTFGFLLNNKNQTRILNCGYFFGFPMAVN